MREARRTRSVSSTLMKYAQLCCMGFPSKLALMDPPRIGKRCAPATFTSWHTAIAARLLYKPPFGTTVLVPSLLLLCEISFSDSLLFPPGLNRGDDCNRFTVFLGFHGFLGAYINHITLYLRTISRFVGQKAWAAQPHVEARGRAQRA